MRMKKVKPLPLNQEQLIYYLLQNVSLGTYDKRFLNNTMQLNVAPKKPVTTNQAELLRKITLRYVKQLTKQELNINDLINLPWVLEPTPSLAQYTDAFVYVEDNLLKVRSPYKTEFVKSLRDLGYLTWNREERTWHSTYSEHTLKPVIGLVKYHFNDINLCDEVESALNTVDLYKDMKYWNPTLISRNGALYIFAVNQGLHEAIKHIPLTLSLHTIAVLVFYGVTIDDDVVSLLNEQMGNTPESLKLIHFAINRTPSLELVDTTTLVEYVASIKADYVVLSDLYGINNLHLTNIRNGLSKYGIKHEVIDRKISNMTDILDFKRHTLPIVINTGIWRHNPINTAAKMISLVNSQPINAYSTTKK